VRDAIARAGGLKRLHQSADAVLAEALEAEGWTYTPPKPVLPVVSEEARRAYDKAWMAAFSDRSVPEVDWFNHGLRAAFKVMLRENLLAAGYLRNSHVAAPVYRDVTGEDWPA